MWRDAAAVYLNNGTMFPAVNSIYTSSPVGIYFWPIVFMFTLVLTYIKTESSAAVFTVAIIGNVGLVYFLDYTSHYIFYITIVFSLAMTFWSFIGSPKIGE